jgi:two-component system phosphate regulon sensor histidine kinase PhoR
VKKVFPAILVLITLSLASLFYMQYAWLNNVQKVQEEQIRHQVADAANRVADELGAYKGSASIGGTARPFPGLDGTLDLPHSFSISQRFTAQEIYEKIRLQFLSQKLDKVPFEFGIAANSNGYYLGRRSNNFDAWYADTVNHYQYVTTIRTPSGSAVENLSADEVLILIIPRVDDIVGRQLRSRIALAILFTIIIIAAFGLTLITMLRQKKLAQIKNDFINNMTHEFKTPIATISLAVDALRNEKVQVG